MRKEAQHRESIIRMDMYLQRLISATHMQHALCAIISLRIEDNFAKEYT